jgi:hypothetical protein
MLEEITPDPLELSDEQDLNKERYGSSLGSVIGDERDFQHLLDYQSAHDGIKALEEAKQLAKNNLTTKMKNAEELKFEGGRILWRRSEGKKDYFNIKIYK